MNGGKRSRRTKAPGRGGTEDDDGNDDGLGYVSAEGGSLPAIMSGYVKGGRIEWLDDGGEVFKLASRDPDTYIAVTTAVGGAA